MSQSRNATTLLIACAVFGFSVGNVLTFRALIIHREFVATVFPMLISFSTAITQFAYALGRARRVCCAVQQAPITRR